MIYIVVMLTALVSLVWGFVCGWEAARAYYEVRLCSSPRKSSCSWLYPSSSCGSRGCSG